MSASGNGGGAMAGQITKNFSDLTERELLALAITLEEEDARIYDEFADGLRDQYPDTAKMFTAMAEEENAHRHRLLVGGGEDQREDEIVPGEDEGEESGCGDARHGKRHGDLAEGLPPGVSGDAVRVLDVGADILEIAAHDPEDERQADELIDPDQADIGVGEAKRLEIERQRQEHEQRRREAEGEEREGDVLAKPEAEAREDRTRRDGSSAADAAPHRSR